MTDRARHRIALLALALTAAACEARGRPAPADSAPHGATEVATPELAVPCVAGGSLFITPVLAERLGWHGRVFRDLGQARFCPVPTGVDEAYRFTWIPSFTPPAGVTLERRGSAWTLASRAAAQPFRVMREGHPEDTLSAGPPAVRTRALTAGEAAALEAALRRARFWSMAPREEAPGVDGVEWVMEGARDGRYHAVDRWSPGRERDPAYHALGQAIYRLAGISPAQLDDDTLQ